MGLWKTADAGDKLKNVHGWFSFDKLVCVCIQSFIACVETSNEK